MKVGRSELWAGRAFLVGLMVFTILPFISIFMTALHPSGSVPEVLNGQRTRSGATSSKRSTWRT